MPEVDQQKCNALYGDDAGSITDAKRVELTDAWETENISLINSVAGDITNAMAQFNREVGTDPRLSGLLWTQSEINSFTDPRTWDYGGADGYGEFGESGEIVQALEAKKESVRQVRDAFLASQQNIDLVPLLNDLFASNALDEASFFGSGYSSIREAYLERYQIDTCYLNSDIERLEELEKRSRTPQGGAFLLGARPEILRELEEARQRLADLEAGNLETENIGRRLFEGKTLEFKEQCFLLSNLLNLAKIKEQFDHGNPGSATIPVETQSFNQTNNTSTQTSVLITGSIDYPLDKKLPFIDRDINRTVMATGTPFGFINKLTQTPTKDAFFEMDNAQLSSLQPMMRLYKVIENEKTTPQCPSEKQVEIKFDPSATQHGLGNLEVQDFLTERKNRNPGVGVKSFNFTYDGYNPYAIKKSISARLVIHANSFNELLLERQNAGSTDIYRYIDLVLKTGGVNTVRYARLDNDVALENLDKLNFRLKAVLGWENPMFTNRGIFKSDVLSGINNQAVTLNLTPTTHDFAFDDIGRVTMTINYLAYIEDYYDNPTFNIFSSRLVTFNTLVRNLQYQTLNKKCLKDELDKRKQDDIEEEAIKEEKEKSLRYLMNSLLSNRKIYSISIAGEDIPIFGNGGPYGRASSLYTKDNLLDNIRRTIRDEFDFVDNAATNIELEPPEESDNPPPLQNDVVFFYAGDLVDTVLQNIGDTLYYIYDNLTATNLVPGLQLDQVDQQIRVQEYKKYERYIENYKKMRVLLGPLEIVKPNSNDTTIINLGDVPISFKHFLEWLTTRLLDKNIETFTLPSFLNSFFNQYIIDYLNQDICYGGKAKQRINLNQTALTEYRDNQDDPDTITKKCNTAGGIGGNPGDQRYRIKCPSDQLVTVDVRGTSIELEECTRRLYIPQEMDPEKYPLLRVMGVRDDPRPDTGVCNEINYLAYYAGRTIPVGEMIGCKKATTRTVGEEEQTGCFKTVDGNPVKISDTGDHEKGIWHYQIGKDRGIVKSINLQKTDTPGLAEVRFEQDGYDGLRQLRVLYDVTIKTYLDVSLFPGTYIYVDPKGFDPSSVTADFDLTDLGIGGYCMVWKSEHTIVAGQPESTLYAKWVASRDASVIKPLAEGEADETNDNCGTIAAE